MSQSDHHWLGLMAGRGFGLRDRMATQVERNRLDTGDAVSVLKLVFAITIAVEAIVAAVTQAGEMVGQTKHMTAGAHEL